MYVDLNVPVPLVATQQQSKSSKKGKGKQNPQSSPPSVVFTPGQLTELETRIDLLIHLGYTVIALNQTVQRKVDPKTHANVLTALLPQLRKREGIVYVTRLTIVLDEESEKGFGLTPGNASLFAPYDLIALLPTTATSFSLACLTHTAPSPLTAHIISLPLTLPRLPFNLKHTLVRTALKNGAVFEIAYTGALGSEPDPALGTVASGESGSGGKRNWWAAAREVARVTKGKGIVVTSGAVNQTSLRAPRDVGNLISMLDLPQNVTHDALTKLPRSLILRAQTRRTYRAILSEPRIVIPAVVCDPPTPNPAVAESSSTVEAAPVIPPTEPLPSTASASGNASDVNRGSSQSHTGTRSLSKKRALEDATTPQDQAQMATETSPKKKRKKAQDKQS